MRTFFRDHWKAIVVIVVLILLAMFTVTPGAAAPTPSLAARLRAHVEAIAPGEHGAGHRHRLEQAARYIEAALKDQGYAVRRHDYLAGGRRVRNIQVSLANLAPQARPARIFFIGAHYDAAPDAPGATDNGSGSGTAAVLELARLLKDLRPSQGTELRFVFFVAAPPPWSGDGDAPADPGSFIAFAGTLASSRLVQQALSAFQDASGIPARGPAAAAYAQGQARSGMAAREGFGYPAVVIAGTAFGRYPCYEAINERPGDTSDQLDYADVARVVNGLARTIEALAGAQRG